MADRYWVGGTGNWDGSTTTNWSASSGGAGGASVPTSADNVFFDANSDAGGTFTVTLTTTANCLDLTVSGLDNTMTFAGTSALNVYGSLSYPATNFSHTRTGTTTFRATSSKTITTNGISFGGTVSFNGVAGQWTLQDDFTGTASGSNTLVNGTLALNDKTLSLQRFSLTGTSTKVISFSTSGVINLTTSSAATALDFSGTTGFSWTGTPSFTFNPTYAGTNTITFDFSGAYFTESTALNVYSNGSPATAVANAITLPTGTKTYFLQFNGSYKDIDFTYNGNSVIGINCAADNFIYGNLKLPVGVTTSGSTSRRTTLASTSSGKVISLNGASWTAALDINGVGGTWTFGSAVATQGNEPSFQIINGSVDASTYSLTCSNGCSITNDSLTMGDGALSASNVTVSSGKQLTLGSGGVTLTGNGTIWNVSGATFSVGTSNITTTNTSAGAKTFIGGSKTYNKVTFGGATGSPVFTITGNNTFSEFATIKTVACTFTFAAGTTQTVGKFTVRGNVAKLITLNSSTPTSTYTLSASSGIIDSNYLSIQDSIATGGATWYAGINSTNAGNNTGWIFESATAGNFIHFFV